ncbi:hypothetical protein PSV08DRAFT_370773 [Bipolaris maydis]|uniref:uncharacterized protein n=1 Tax=Cochliobolus heterostrophus TaxID=5016 RepID=UPI0024D46E1A|nr:hypothetical protein J3E73DRAFT_390898 [Bipolaris maydis]KAJ6271448.1 hypothetical protein PSV08DRAFT_370773 [Bipolaris maydis]
MGEMPGCRCHIRQRATTAKHAFTPWAAADASRGIFLRLTACTVDGTWTRALLRGETSSEPKASKLRLKSTLLESMHRDDCLAVMLGAHAGGRVDAIPIHGGGLDMEMEMPSPSSGPHGCCPSSRGGVLDELEVITIWSTRRTCLTVDGPSTAVVPPHCAASYIPPRHPHPSIPPSCLPKFANPRAVAPRLSLRPATQSAIRHPAPRPPPARHCDISHVARQSPVHTLSALRQAPGRVGKEIRGLFTNSDIADWHKTKSQRVTCRTYTTLIKMDSAAPPRRFKPEPIETTVSSSKDKARQEPVEAPKPRRFAPQPIETTTSSSKARRRFAPEPFETTTTSSKANRKFIPEPIETTATSSKVPRRFAPQPLETTTRSNRRFVPQPLETTTRSSRQKFARDWEEQTSPTDKFKPSPLGPASRKLPVKRFRPQLIETAQRHRRAGDDEPVLFDYEKTEATPESAISARKARILGIPPTPPVNTPTYDMSQNPLFLEIQRNASPLSRRRSYFSSSQHSFRVPDLDPIESSESEASAPPSPTESPPYRPDHSFMYKEATRRRESADGTSAGYLLELAAKAAEKQLREQALAAFPNSDIHEPVAHYVDRDTEGSEPSVTEAKPQPEPQSEIPYTVVNWELEAMRKYQAEQIAEKEKPKPTEHAKPAFSPFGNPAGFLDAATASKFAKERKDPELERQRREARPPMLGQDIKFPRCESPEPSRFDPTQGCDAVRTAMCYLSEQSKAASEKGESLWCGKGNGRQTSTTPSLWSTANSRASSTHGLWGGFCVNGGDKSPRGPTGLLTPNTEIPNPISPYPTPSASLLPPTPPASSSGATFAPSDFAGIDEKLAVEQSIEEEFGDDFVTQVYNYLSLGYPSMARPFDAELSKISHIPISELRQDDHLAKSRGYIRLGKDGNLKDSEITEETCMQWARQHPNMADEDLTSSCHGTVAIRRGSWAQ